MLGNARQRKFCHARIVPNDIAGITLKAWPFSGLFALFQLITKAIFLVLIFTIRALMPSRERLIPDGPVVNRTDLMIAGLNRHEVATNKNWMAGKPFALARAALVALAHLAHTTACTIVVDSAIDGIHGRDLARLIARHPGSGSTRIVMVQRDRSDRLDAVSVQRHGIHTLLGAPVRREAFFAILNHA